jgi:hypothetical protein
LAEELGVWWVTLAPTKPPNIPKVRNYDDIYFGF